MTVLILPSCTSFDGFIKQEFLLVTKFIFLKTSVDVCLEVRNFLSSSTEQMLALCHWAPGSGLTAVRAGAPRC